MFQAWPKIKVMDMDVLDFKTAPPETHAMRNARRMQDGCEEPTFVSSFSRVPSIGGDGSWFDIRFWHRSRRRSVTVSCSYSNFVVGHKI